MLEGKAYVKDTDMDLKMQVQATDSASQALDLYDVIDYTSIAAHIKKEFDHVYGGGWQCVVGSSFGSFFTHSKGTFIYFSLETLSFLIFKTRLSATSFTPAALCGEIRRATPPLEFLKKDTMARFLSRSTRQLYSSRYLLQPQHVVPVRFYAKEASSKAPNGMMKRVFLGMKDDAETAIGALRSKMYRYARALIPLNRASYFDSLRLNFFMVRVFNKTYDPSEPGFEMMLMDTVEKFDEKTKEIYGDGTDKEFWYAFLKFYFTTKWQMEGIRESRTCVSIITDMVFEDFAKPRVLPRLMDIVDKVEAKIKKPLTVYNHKGNELLVTEIAFNVVPRIQPEMLTKDGRAVYRGLMILGDMLIGG